MRAAWRSLSMTFAVHLAMIGLALAPALALGGFLAVNTGTLGADVTPTGIWLDLLAGARHGGPVLWAFAGATTITVLASAPLQMAWLGALAGATGRAAFRRGLARTPDAWLTSLLVLGFGALAFLASLCLPIAAHLLVLDHLPNERTHDLAVLALSVPALLVVVGAACAHDLARAALVAPRVGPFVAFVSALVALPSARPAAYLAFLLLEALLTVLALDASLRGGTAWAASLATIAAQLLLFGRSFVRSVWLARCVGEMPARASRRLPPAEPVTVAGAEPPAALEGEPQSG